MVVKVIATLDVMPPHVVKPVHFEGLRKMGNPSELAKKYYDQGADVLFYIDIVSSLYQREIYLNDILSYLNVSKVEFDSIVDASRPEHLWSKQSGKWALI